MLDKSKIYAGYSKPYRGINQSPTARFKRVKILYEDDISFYVASLMRKDGAGHHVHFSIKKHCFHLIAITEVRTPELCKTCPFHTAVLKWVQRNKILEDNVT